MNAEICKQLGISRSVTSAYHPQTNGLDERTNQTLKVRMAKLVNEHQDDWDEYLEEIAFSIRTQKQVSTKYSPFFLMFGRHARSPMEVRKSCWKQALFLLLLVFKLNIIYYTHIIYWVVSNKIQTSPTIVSIIAICTIVFNHQHLCKVFQ